MNQNNEKQTSQTGKNPDVTTAQSQINFILTHAATSQVAAHTTAEQIRFALKDISPEAGSNRLPAVLQTALDTADILDRLASTRLEGVDQASEDALRARIAELEKIVEKLNANLADETKLREAAEAKVKASGFMSHYKSVSGKTVGVGQFVLARTAIPTTLVYLLGANHPLVQALLKLLP